MKGRYCFGRFIVYYLLVLAILRIGFGPFSWYFPQSDFFAEVTSSALFELVNETRQEKEISPLRMNPQLNLAAYQKAQDMLENQYFAHHSPAGIDPWHWFSLAGYQYRYAGENLAIHFLDSGGVHQAWMESESHRRNILNANYQEMGMAVVRGEFEGRMTTLVVQLFGTPQEIAVARVEPADIVAPEPERVDPVREVAEVPAEDRAVESAPEEPEEYLPSETEEMPGTDWLAESDLRIAGAASVVTEELNDDNWFRLFKFISRSYERAIQQMIFYGIVLVSIYFIVSLIRRPEEGINRLCARTAFWTFLLFAFSLLTKDTVLRWISYQVIIG